MSVTIKKKAPVDVVSSGKLTGAVEVAFPSRVRVSPESLINHERNPREHSEEQLQDLMNSIKTWGWTVPAVVSEDMVILAGHGRVEAARRLGLEEIEVAVVSGWDEFKQRAYMIADNQLALMSYWDWGVLSSEMDSLGAAGFDLELLGMSFGSKANLSAHKMSSAPPPLPGSVGVPGSMAKKFVMVPFSVLSVADPWWVEERTTWLTRGLVQGDLACLCDLMLRWFCPAGGGVRGVANTELLQVAKALGFAADGGDFVFVDGIASPGTAHQQLLEAAPLLGNHRFAVVVLQGDCPPDVLFSLLESARSSGLRYYNELAVDGMGSGEGEDLPCRHALVLVFVKGDEREATSAVGAVLDVEVPRKELTTVPVVVDPHALTPIMDVGDVWMKRDDFFAVGTARGGKVRSCLALSEGAAGLTTAGSRASPQVNIVAQVAKFLGVPASAHLPKGELSPCVKETEKDIEIIQHKAGYNNVIIKRARDDAAARGWREVPFGMECDIAVNCTRKQVAGIPEGVQRIIIPVGSGMSLAGVLWGLKDQGLTIPVVGVSVGADPTPRLDAYAPPEWRDMVQIVKSDLDYHDYAPESIFRGVQLDPIYEAKVIPFVQPGDLFWVVGIRSTL